MATTSEVKQGLDDIAGTIRSSQQLDDRAAAGLLAARNQLAALPTTFSDVLVTIDAYTPTGAFETVAQDEKSALTTEFLALKAAIEAKLTALGIPF